MRSRVRVALALLLLAGAWRTTVQAQATADRIVGNDFFGKPLVISTLTGSSVGALAGAAQVPMGFEAAVSGGPANMKIEATGRTLRSVLDAIVAADSRYEWHDESGVLVLRPAEAWFDRENALHRSVAPIQYDSIGVREALRIVAALLGRNLPASQSDDLRDPRRFALSLPPGSVLDALNGIVRAHGTLAWSLEPSPRPTHVAPGTRLSPFMVTLTRASGGRGTGLGVDLKPPIPMPEDLEPPPPPQPGTGPVLDRIVGRKANSLPLLVRGPIDVPELATAARVPMGVELMPVSEPRVLTKGDGTNVTGMALRDALAALIALDPRYEWREMDGVIVVRPVSVWTDTGHPLLREVAAAHISRVTLQDAVALQQTLLEPGKRYVPLNQNADVTVRRLSLDLPAGTLMALANATARAHGWACWIYEELNERDTAFFGGRSHQLSTQAPDSGMGFAFR
jgi:hypothetical protein